MSEFPWAFQQIEPTTWAYVSSLLMLALFFKFSRLWSIRNLDLVLLVMLAPGLLLYNSGVSLERHAVAELNRLGYPATLSLTSGGLLEAQVGRAPEPTTGPNGAPNANPPSRTNTPTPTPTPTPTDSKTESNADSNTASDTDSNTGTNTESDIKSNAQSDRDSNTQSIDGTARGSGVEPESRSSLPPADDAVQPGESASDTERKVWLARRSLSHAFLYSGFLFLLVVGLLFVVRLLLDQLLVRRPAIEPNLSSGGLWLLVASLLTYLLAHTVVSSPTRTDVSGAQSAAELLQVGQATTPMADQEMGPAYPLLHVLPVIPTMLREANARGILDAEQLRAQRSASLVWVAKLMAILSQLAIVAGLVWMGGHHFGNWQNGAGMATLYLMLPYTVQMSGAVDHVLPGALLLWAVLLYRRPFWSGLLFGLTMGLVYYPIFLLALWLSFYWEKGVTRFLAGVGVTVLLMILSLLIFSTEDRSFSQNLQAMFGVWLPRVSGLKGIWEFGWDPWFRLPILVAFVSLGVSLVAWPIRKTFGTLMAYSAALLVAVQFWHGYGGGLFMAWYLPLAIATIFRPGLHERIAKTMVR